jgi:hypothetical protein
MNYSDQPRIQPLTANEARLHLTMSEELLLDEQRAIRNLGLAGAVQKSSSGTRSPFRANVSIADHTPPWVDCDIIAQKKTVAKVARTVIHAPVHSGAVAECMETGNE